MTNLELIEERISKLPPSSLAHIEAVQATIMSLVDKIPQPTLSALAIIHLAEKLMTEVKKHPKFGQLQADQQKRN